MRRLWLFGHEYLAPAEEGGDFGAGLDLDGAADGGETRTKTLAEDLAAGLETDKDESPRDPDDLEPAETDDADDDAPLSFGDLLAEQGLNVDGEDDVAKFTAIAERAKRAEQLEQQLAMLQAQQQQLPPNFPHTLVPQQPQQTLQNLPPQLRDYIERAQTYDQIYQSILNAPKRLDYWSYVKQTDDGYAPVDPTDVNAVVDAQLAARWVQQNIPQVIANLPGLIEHTIARKLVEGQGVLPQLFREVATQSVAPAVQPIQQRIQQQEEAAKRAARADELWASIRDKATETGQDGQVRDTPYGQAFRAAVDYAIQLGATDMEAVFQRASKFAESQVSQAPSAAKKAGRQIELLRKQASRTPSKSSAVKDPPKPHTPKRRGEAGKEHALVRDMQKELERLTA